jgi:general secretion pathway protein D
MINMKRILGVACFLVIGLLIFISSGCSVSSQTARISKEDRTVDKDAGNTPIRKVEIESTDTRKHMLETALEKNSATSITEAKPEIKEQIGYKREILPRNDMAANIQGQKILFDGAASRSEQPKEKNKEGAGIIFNFDDAELPEVLRALADMLGYDYILDPGIRGKVTIHSTVPVDKKQLNAVFLQVLDMNGLTAVQVGDLYQIGKSKDAGRMPLVSRIGKDPSGSATGQRFIMQIIPLSFISAEQMSKLLTPFVSMDGTIVNNPESNVMIIVDKEANILKALKLVEVFDTDIFTTTNHAIYRLEHVNAKEMAGVVQDLVMSYSKDLQKETKIISIDRLNALIVFSKKTQLFEKIEAFIRKLDVSTYNVEPQIFIYSVKNGQAGELSRLLGTVFGIKGSGAKKEDSTRSDALTAERRDSSKSDSLKAERMETSSPFEVDRPKNTPGEGGLSGSSAGSLSLKNEVRITPDEIRNALIIEAVPADYAIVEKILNKLDVLPRQVLIEVTIAEVTLDDGFEFGMTWNYNKSTRPETDRLSTSLLEAAVSSAGLHYIIGQTNRWQTELTAMAKKNKVNILSAPSVLASDNKEATINISTEIPVATAQYQTTSDTQPLLQTNIQYRNTGVILTVKPHINEFGLVSMDISQEVSEQADAVKVGTASLPSFFKRSVKTALTVNNDQTIVIGGLIRDTRSKGRAGVPILQDIPVLKSLFATNTNSQRKTELVLLITPRVIVNLEDVNAVTEEFKYKVKGIVQHQSE